MKSRISDFLLFLSFFLLCQASIAQKKEAKILQSNGKPYANAVVLHNHKKIKTDTHGWLNTQLKINDTLMIGGNRYVVDSIPYVLILHNYLHKVVQLEDVLVTTLYPKTESLEFNKADISRLKGGANGDLFNGLTGVQVNNIRNEAGAIDIGIRGIQGEGRVPVLIDGSLQSTQTLRGYQGTSDRTYLDMDLIRKVKIDKGGSFNPAVTGATGGVVSLSTIDAEDVVQSGNKMGVLLKTNTFNNNLRPEIPESEKAQQYYIVQNSIPEMQFAGLNATAALAYKASKFDILAAYSSRKEGNYFSGETGAHRYGYDARYYDKADRQHPDQFKNPPVRPAQEVVNTSFNSQSVLVKSGWNITPYHRLEANFRYHHQQAGEVLVAYWFKNDKDINQRPLAAGVESMPQWSLGAAKVYATSLLYKYTPTAKINLNVSLFDNEASLHQHNGLAQTIGANYGDQYLHRYKNRRSGITVYNSMSFSPLPLNLKYGITAQVEKTTPLEVPQNRIGSARFAKREEYNAFVSGSFEWKKITIQADVKTHHATVHDYVDTTTKKYGINTDFSGKLVYAPLGWLKIFGKASKVLRSPSLHEATKSLQVFSYDKKYPLAPEATTGFGLGVQTSVGSVLSTSDRLTVIAEWFYNNTKKFISTAVLLPDYDFAFINYDRYMLKGFDLNVSYKSAFAFVDASAIFYDNAAVCSEIMGKSHNVESCNSQGFDWSVLPNRIPPRQSLFVMAGIYAFDKKLSLGGTFKYHSRKENPKNWLAGTGATGVAVTLPEDHIIGLFGSYRYNRYFYLNVNVDNLTDRYQYDVGSVIKMPVPGRTIRVGVEITL